MKVKMIIERIIKALLKSKVIYGFALIYSHDLVSGNTRLNMLLLMRPESLLLAGLSRSLVLKKCFCFYQEICFSFLPMGHVNFRKMQILLYMERRSSYKIKLESFKLPRSVFSRLEIFMVLMEFFVVSFKWNLLIELP